MPQIHFTHEEISKHIHELSSKPSSIQETYKVLDDLYGSVTIVNKKTLEDLSSIIDTFLTHSRTLSQYFINKNEFKISTDMVTDVADLVTYSENVRKKLFEDATLKIN